MGYVCALSGLCGVAVWLFVLFVCLILAIVVIAIFAVGSARNNAEEYKKKFDDNDKF